MQDFNFNVVFTISERQMQVLSWKHTYIFEWIEFLNSKTGIDVFTSRNEIFDFCENESINTHKNVHFFDSKNDDEYEKYSLNIFNHSGIKVWISKNSYNGHYGGWDGGELGYFFVRKNWKYKDKFIKLISESCSLLTQYMNGYFDWVMDLSDEEVKEIFGGNEVDSCCSCDNHRLSIEEMRNEINSREMDFYDYEYDKFGLEFINENLFSGEYLDV